MTEGPYDPGPGWWRVFQVIVTLALIMIAVLALTECTPLRPPVPAAFVDVQVRGFSVCSGTRVKPDELVTARHCTEHGWDLRVEGRPAFKVASQREDVARLRVAPGGPVTPEASYVDESHVTIHTRWGVVVARVLRFSPATGLELGAECVRADSGSPVTTARGVVGVVVRGAKGSDVCYAALLHL